MTHLHFISVVSEENVHFVCDVINTTSDKV